MKIQTYDPKPSLRTLIKRRLGDAKVLLKHRRYPASIYMAGYGLELALKYRICKLMKFSKGFPENRTEFNFYYNDARRAFLCQMISNLREIRHHDLPELLYFSREQLYIESNLSVEWNSIVNWHPGMRYDSASVRMSMAKDFFKNVTVIISKILNQI